MNGWLRAWFSLDPRILGLYRMALGTLCLLDIARRMPYIGMFYSRDGILPVPDPAIEYTFSLLQWMDTAPWLQLFFGVGLIAAFCFALGYRTKLSQLLTWLVLISFHSDRFPTANTGDLVLHLMVMWSFFLPLGERYSLDVRFGRVESRPDVPVWSLAVFAIWIQLAGIYFFNAVEKWGATWTHGDALHYFLHLDTHATALGIWAREAIPITISMMLTYIALFIELIAPLMILTPVHTRNVRRVAFTLLFLHHGSIALLANIGLFSWVMLATVFLLLDPLVEVPTGDARTDEKLEEIEEEAHVAEEPLEEALLDEEEEEALPKKTPRRPLSKAKVSSVFATFRTTSTQICVLVLLTANAIQGLKSHETSRRLLRSFGIEVSQPAPLRKLIYFGGMTQRWRLFAPNVPAGEGRLVVHGTTTGGEDIDLLTKKQVDLGPTLVASGHEFNQFWRKYSRRVAADKTGVHARHLRKYMVDRWNMSGMAGERKVERAKVVWIYDRSPEPGASYGPEVINRKRLD